MRSLDEQTEQFGALFLVAVVSTELEFGEQLVECLAEERQDVSRVSLCLSTEDRDGELTDLKDLIIEGDEQTTQVVSLGEKVVEAVVKC